MTYSDPPENIKACPECGTYLISTAKRCAVCGHRFTAGDAGSEKNEGGAYRPRNRLSVTINLPILLGLILLLVALNGLVILGLQKRGQTKILLAAAQGTATYIATTYVSPTPQPTATFTKAPPSSTPVVDITYTVASGDSCLSIAKRFNIYLDSLLVKNNIDCSVLQIGTVLKIPHPTETPESAGTPVVTVTP